MKTRVLVTLISTFLLAALSLGLVAAPAAAADPADSAITLDQSFEIDRQGNEAIVLSAKLTRADGYPLSERNVSFFETVGLFGTARIPLGSAVTSAVGVATLKYETRQAGEHQFTALFAGDETAKLAMVNAMLNIEKLPAMAPLSPPTGMEAISHWSLVGVGLVVLAVWTLLLGVVVYVAHGIRKTARQPGI